MKPPTRRNISFDYEGETVKLAYNPRRMAGDDIGEPPSGDDILDVATRRVRTIAEWSVRNLVWWSLSDKESGDVLPITVDSLEGFHDDGLILRIGEEIGNDAVRLRDSVMRRGKRGRLWVRPARI